MAARKGNDYDDRRRAANHACSSVVSWQIEAGTNDRWRSVGGIVSKTAILEITAYNVAVKKSQVVGKATSTSIRSKDETRELAGR